MGCNVAATIYLLYCYSIQHHRVKQMAKSNHPTNVNGKIFFLEIPAVDVILSASFYKKVFGWQIRERNDGRIVFEDSVNEVSGTWILGRPATAEPGVLIYIMVKSIPATVRAIAVNGGKIVQPAIEDPLTARFTDPAGNVFGLSQEPE
jgi:predicted enzyme related to lactoylglutathione lyase